MTDRLYYHDSFLYSFDACVVESLLRDGKHALVLDQTAFYPTSGGQVHDTGRLVLTDESEVAVTEVADDEENGHIFHFAAAPIAAGTAVRGRIDAARRRDHMQQHSGQHVLSAAFIRLFNMPTVSFHMGTESCTIDLDTPGLSSKQVEQAERLANEIVLENRPVTIHFVPLEEARHLGLRKLPPKQKGDLRLIDITDFDLTACGGTHVRSTGQIGAILLRKTEKVKQGMRAEFVCGLRAVATAREDYQTLSETAALYSSHIRDLPRQARKLLEESKSAGKAHHKLLEELAQLQAEQLLANVAGPLKIITAVFPGRDAPFIKLLAQKLTASRTDVVALLASGVGQPALVFAQSAGQRFNMGQLMKETMAQLGGRGGGAADLAQGGLPEASADPAQIEIILHGLRAKF
jgi:alanyl-tRNA synthetase